MAFVIGLLASTACAGDLAGDFDEGLSTGDDGGSGTTGYGDGDGDGDGDGEGGDGDGDGDGDGEPDSCTLDCGSGDCVEIDWVAYCDCPEGTLWTPQGCDACPVVDQAIHDLDVQLSTFSGRFLAAGAAPPKSEYDDANLWLENGHTGDRVALGNTHDGTFSVRVTPGIYDVVYESETPGVALPHNEYAHLGKVALFGPVERDIEIPVAIRSGNILINDVAAPKSEYDDANIFFRDPLTGEETLAANSHDGAYSVNLVPGLYEVVYRVETPGDVVPHNDGAVIDTLEIYGTELLYDVEVAAVPLNGDFQIAGKPAPMSEYDDANIDLVSDTMGSVWLGNTHDQTYDVNVIPGSYALVYRHETGVKVPQNTRASFGQLDVNEGGTELVNVPMVEISGAMTINDAAPPVSEFDDGILHLRGVGSEDRVWLGNTHSGSYQVNVIPGDYEVYYAQETAGGTVPENKSARIADLSVQQAASTNLDVDAVQISGQFTLSGATPPSSEYEDGRVYLRNLTTGDAILLGSTHEGSYSAVVVPGMYEAFYTLETGGAVVPGNQDASLGPVQVGGPMDLDLDISVVGLGGKTLLAGEAAPDTPSDGGQLYLRTAGGDSVLLGDSYGASYEVKLVSGTYGVYYRAENSVTMPENENGRFSCITIP